MHVNRRRQGKRNRQRGAELQREVVKLAKEFGLQAWNRDRGGAMHELGDVEIDGLFYGCKRRKAIASYIYPDKAEHGVFIRAERKGTLVVIPARIFMSLLSMYKTGIQLLGREQE